MASNGVKPASRPSRLQVVPAVWLSASGFYERPVTVLVYVESHEIADEGLAFMDTSPVPDKKIVVAGRQVKRNRREVLFSRSQADRVRNSFLQTPRVRFAATHPAAARLDLGIRA